MMRVAIVGGGAAGVLAAVHLRRATPDAQITLIDASGRPGTGAAYGTDDPTHLLRLPWDSTLFLSRSWAYYDGPDPCCSTSGNPFVFSPSDRFDRHWRFGVTQSFQVGGNISVVLQLQRDIVSSNLSLYGYTSDSVLVGPQIRF